MALKIKEASCGGEVKLRLPHELYPAYEIAVCCDGQKSSARSVHHDMICETPAWPSYTSKKKTTSMDHHHHDKVSIIKA